MDSLFTSVLEISWQAGLIALAVMAVRPLLRRAPRRAVCMLWLLVALRLLLPARLTVESPVSLQQPESPPIQAYQELRQQEKVYVSAPPEQRLEMAGPAAAQGFALLDQLPAIWLTGVGCMALYMALSLLRMRWRLRAAPRIQDNVYRCTDWSTPFVLGVLAPRIYVPETVSEQDFPQVLAHERCHIRRWDHVWKPLAFLLLAVNWFNPVLWAAYVLLGRDMERACDEMVLKNATPIQRAAYSRALVACATQPKMAAVCPLAFGEVAVKERVKNVLNYKKPALWAVILLVVAAAIIGACLLTKPGYKNVGTLDAEKLFALRTEYVGDNAAVSGILDALGFRAAGAAGDGQAYTYSFEVENGQRALRRCGALRLCRRAAAAHRGVEPGDGPAGLSGTGAHRQRGMAAVGGHRCGRGDSCVRHGVRRGLCGGGLQRRAGECRGPTGTDGYSAGVSGGWFYRLL